METLRLFIAWLRSLFIPAPQPQPITPPPMPTPPPSPAPVPTPAPQPLDWSTPQGAFHLTRVLADKLGLTVPQKNILCACIYQESHFLNRHSDGTPVVHVNRNPDGSAWSTDYGICQVNDYFHIGAGKDFPTVAYVMDNPEEAVAWMAGVLKRTGALKPWDSYTSGAYKQWLVPTSPMWLLRS